MDIEDLARVKVYSASRHLEEARLAPAAVSIITAEEIRRYGWRTLGDVLVSLRGFYTATDREYTYLGVRGFLRPGDYNSRILLQIDGHRMNDNVYDFAFFGSEFSLDLDLVHHIEVVRGPGSSLYGTNAIFGVINVVTRQPKTERALEAAGEASTFVGRTGRVTMMGGKGGVQGLASATFSRSDGQEIIFLPQFESPQTNNGFAIGMDGSRLAQGFAEVRGGGFTLAGLLSDRVKKFPTASYGTVFNNPEDWAEDTRGYLEASLHRQINSETELDLRAYYDAYNSVGSGAIGNLFAGPPVHVFQKARADWVGGEANLTRKLGKQRITGGGEYEYSVRILQRNLVEGGSELFRSDQSPWHGAVYGEAELNLFAKLSIHAGARYDWSSGYGNVASPRVAVIYTPNAATSVKYLFGEAFRAPNAYEEYYADGVVIAPPPKQLLPEKVESHEIVAEHSFLPWLAVTGDAFSNRLRKLIDQVPNRNTGMSYFVNDGSAQAEGLELEVNAARASYSVSQAENSQSRSPMANLPVSMVKLDGAAPPSRHTFAALEMLYEGPLTDYRGTRVPAAMLPNLTFSTKPVLGGWTFSASCYDALNHGWYSPMGPNDPEDQIRMEGRTFRFKIQYRSPAHERRNP